jgi:hypothetical protein
LVVWLMVIWLPATEPEAVPETTVPFCGRPARTGDVDGPARRREQQRHRGGKGFQGKGFAACAGKG